MATPAPLTVVLYTLRAECHLKHKDFKEALRDADMALRGDDGSCRGWNWCHRILELCLCTVQRKCVYMGVALSAKIALR